MNILLTGGAGYIGSLVSKKLVSKGLNVTILDKFSFGLEPIRKLSFEPNFKIIYGDITDIEVLEKSVKGIDKIIHLAGIVGDPACAVNASLAIDVNERATKSLATIAKKNGIKDFIFASTCNVYGASDNDQLSETSVLNPVSLYAETKLHSESDLMSLAGKNFNVTIMRLGTIFGLSPRMRFDLVINFLTKKLLLTGDGKIFGGSQWRPFVNVDDVATAICLILESPISLRHNEIFNIGTTDQNFQLKDIGQILEKVFPDASVDYLEEIKDKRSYNVSFKKFENTFNFKSKHTIKSAVVNMKNAIESGLINNPDDKKYMNYNAE